MHIAIAPFNPMWVVIALTVLTQFLIFLRWLWRKWASDEIERVFVEDMATNHLPHIYHALEAIAEHHGVKIGEPPPVRWIQLPNERQRSN